MGSGDSPTKISTTSGKTPSTNFLVGVIANSRSLVDSYQNAINLNFPATITKQVLEAEQLASDVDEATA